ncbi:Xaa-Pro peptidase family protein [Radiobacillus kanasensis]|uniref:M24 family metallopeptidase n=1 Tax=Radiobacillus kanasensis TaxID=2844358 RepID=UPI001E307569|nr:Xaa-Pro peptidase family protein [Radiobacillus kanasensis]UFT98832.1 Xaa-Pro peptidase family protein [Radiobacillus kanasensis]
MTILQKIRNTFKDYEIDGLMITNSFNRRYVTKFTGTAGIVLISKEKSLLLTDFRYMDQATKQAKGFEVVNAGRDIDKLAKLVHQLGIKKLGFESKNISYDDFHTYNEAIESDLIPVTNLLEPIRSIKTQDEIDCIKEAAKITDEAFTHILNFIKPGVKEIEVSNEIERVMRDNGATSSGYDMIVASGYRSSLPHGVASSKVIEKGDLVTLDIGALYNGYRSDMTRTVAVGEISDKWKEIYTIVNDALTIQINGIKAGITAQEADALSRNFIASKGYGEYYGHGSGHGVGLEIHELPFMSTTSKDIIEKNMLITIEPGIYLPDEAGVRIEDDVLVTESGCEIITSSSKELLIL